MSKFKEKVYILIIILLVGLSAHFYYTYQYRPAHQVNVYYNQEHQLNTKIIDEIRDADEFVYFGIYTFTRNDIKDALLAAKYRGLNVVGLTDRNQVRDIELQQKIIDELKKAEIPVYEQGHAAIMHLKVLVTDKAYVSGSFNWTSAATNLNDEVLEIGYDNNIRQQYKKILETLFEKYQSPSMVQS